MDPNAAWNNLCEALRDRDMDTAQEYAEALQGWIVSGGFGPKGVSKLTALNVARVVNGCEPASWIDKTKG